MKLALVLVLALLAVAPLAHAGEPPGPERLAQLSAALDRATFVRVTARRGTFEARRVFADSAGLRLVRTPGRAALFVSADAPSDERRLAWSEIEGIEAGRASSAAPLAIGVALGAAVTVGALVAASGSDSEAVAYAAIWAVPLGIGISLGGLLLSAGHSGMLPVYP
jgi:hypothetical protein